MGELDRIIHEAASLHDAGRYEEAMALYSRAITLYPGISIVWNNRGNTLLEMNLHEEAARSYQRALSLSPDLYESRVALASCLQALGQYKAALECCDMVLEIAPEHAEAHWNRALLLLLAGDYSEGFSEYEWRWKKRRFTSPFRDFEQPLWRGEPLSGKTILIHAEQGFGDTIQFCRYLPILVTQGAMVLFECHQPLLKLMSTLGEGIKAVPMGHPIPHFDFHLPLLSLPHLFKTTLENLPASIPYLKAPPERLPFWHSVLSAEKRIKAGICRAGKSYPDPGRSIPFEALYPLAGCREVAFVSLQIDGEVGKSCLSVIELAMLVQDFADTAAIIEQLDLVITIDTAVAHLAGALGKKTWLLLPFAPDWRWGLERHDSPWYPTMRLFRQKQAGDWVAVVREVAEALSG